MEKQSPSNDEVFTSSSECQFSWFKSAHGYGPLDSDVASDIGSVNSTDGAVRLKGSNHL